MAGVMVEYALGQSTPEVQFLDSTTVVTICGNALRFQQLSGGTQDTRFLWGAGRGISAFAVNARKGLIAYAEKGLNPCIYVHDSQTLDLVAKLSDVAELEILRLAFFADGSRLAAFSGVPEYELTVHDVTSGTLHARAKLAAAADGVAVNPRNEMQLCARVGGALTLWTLERSYESYYLTSKLLSTDTYDVSSHAWTNTGALLAGCSTGELLLIDTETGRLRGPQFLEHLDRVIAESATGGREASGGKEIPTDALLAGGKDLKEVIGARKPGFSATEKGNKIPLGPVGNNLPGKLGGVGAKSIRQGVKSAKTPGERSKGIPEVLFGDGEPVAQSQQPVNLLAVSETHVLVGGLSSGLKTIELRKIAVEHRGPSPVDSFKRQSDLVIDVTGRKSPGLVRSLTHVETPVKTLTGSLIDEEKPLDLGGAKPVSLTQNSSLPQQLLVMTSDGTMHSFDVTTVNSKTGSANQEPSSKIIEQSAQVSARDENGASNQKAETGPTAHPQPTFHFGGLSGLAILTPLKLLVTAGREDKALCFWGMERGNFVARKGLSTSATCIQACDSKQLIAWGSGTGVLRIVHVDAQATCVTIFHRKLHVAPIQRLRFSASGAFLASQSADGRVFVSRADRGFAFNPLGYVTLTEKVCDLRWSPKESTEGTLYLALSSGEIIRLEVPESAPRAGDLLYDNAELKWASFNVDEPMVAIEIVPANRSEGLREALLVGMTTDKYIRHYTLPEGSDGWTGPGGRARAPVFERMAHAKPQGALGLSADGKVTVTGAADGALQLRPTLTDVPSQDAGELQLHDAFSGGIRHVAVSSGRVFTAGADGVVFVCDAVDAGISRTDARREHRMRQHKPPNPEDLADVDAPDDPAELDFASSWTDPGLETERAKRSMNGTTETETLEGTEEESADARAVREKVAQLRARFRECEERNRNAPEPEQLPRSDFIVDMDLQASLAVAGAARVGRARAQIAAQVERTQLLRARLKTEFWDAMETHSDILCPLASGADVENFPLRKPGAEEESGAEAAEVRRAELEQLRAGNGSPESEASEAEGRATPMDATVTGGLTETLRPVSADEGGLTLEHQRSVSPADGNAAAQRTAPESADCPTRGLLYGAFELTSSGKKKLQIQLLRRVVREQRAAFNAQFGAARARKRASMEKVAEVNARLAEIQRELGLTDPLTSYSLQDRERNDSLLTVHDNEIRAERYTSPEELRRIEKERKAEEERQRSKGADDPQERALRDMMGGRLRSKAEEEAQAELKRPDWMNGEKGKMSEEQVKLVKEFEAKEKAFKEEKERKRKALELEHKRLLEEAAKPVAAFDEELQALRKHRSQVLSECLEAELQVARLEAAIIVEEETDHQLEVRLTTDADRARDAARAATGALAQFRRAADEKRDEYEMVAAEDKAMEKGFKRDFADCGDAGDALFRLFKRRSKKGAAAGDAFPGASPPSDTSNKIARKSRTSLTLQPSFQFGGPPERERQTSLEGDGQMDYAEKPEGVSDLQWERFLSARERKIALEEDVRARGAQLAEMQRHLAKLAEEDDVAKKRLEDASAGLARFNEKREERRKDLDVPFHIKQGLVEVDLDPFSGGIDDASLLHRSAVEDVNSEVRTQGQQKIEQLTAIKDFKKGIYEAQWQVQKLAMDEEDLTEQIKQFQLLRVTKQLQTVIKNGEDISSANEVAALENRLGHDQKLHEKKLQERAAQLKKLEKQAADITAHTTEVQKRLAVLQGQHDAHARVREIQANAQAARRNATERMKSLVTQRQLQDIAHAQAEEISALRNELEVLRKRTFPRFDPVSRSRNAGSLERNI